MIYDSEFRSKIKSHGLPGRLAIVKQDATAARLHFEAEPEQDHGKQLVPQ